MYDGAEERRQLSLGHRHEVGATKYEICGRFVTGEWIHIFHLLKLEEAASPLLTGPPRS